MAIHDIYNTLSKQLGDDVTAIHLLPTLIPILLDKGLNEEQFTLLVTSIKGTTEIPPTNYFFCLITCDFFLIFFMIINF